MLKRAQRKNRLQTHGKEIAIAAVVLVSCLLALIFYGGWGSRKGVDEDSSRKTLADGSSKIIKQKEMNSREASSGVETIVVYVSGAVRRPGVVTVSKGARIIDALMRAGGVRDDAADSIINLATPLTDGEQIYVPTAKEARSQGLKPQIGGVSENENQAGETGDTQGAAGGGSNARVNINTASADQLETLPGVGPATADKIIADRTKNGPFDGIEDLMRVTGIGEKKVEALRDVAVAR